MWHHWHYLHIQLPLWRCSYVSALLLSRCICMRCSALHSNHSCRRLRLQTLLQSTDRLDLPLRWLHMAICKRSAADLDV